MTIDEITIIEVASADSIELVAVYTLAAARVVHDIALIDDSVTIFIFHIVVVEIQISIRLAVHSFKRHGTCIRSRICLCILHIIGNYIFIDLCLVSSRRRILIDVTDIIVKRKAREVARRHINRTELYAARIVAVRLRGVRSLIRDVLRRDLILEFAYIDFVIWIFCAQLYAIITGIHFINDV